MTTYNYSRINSEQVRVLVLQPGQFGSPLTGHLISCDFVPAKAKKPVYEAISYAWGDAAFPALISILEGDEMPSQQSSRRAGESNCVGAIAITRNLETALQHLRYDDRARVLWCDAICINQGNLAERGTHVSSMGDIYREADRVVVWLGAEADDSDVALDTLAYTASQVKISGSDVSLIESGDPNFRPQRHSFFGTRVASFCKAPPPGVVY